MPDPAEKSGNPVTATLLAVLAVAGGVIAAYGLIQLAHKANDPMRRVNRLLDLCYRKINKLEATLTRNEERTGRLLP